MIKRAFDIFIATTGLVLLSPVMGIIAILIKHDSHGPVIFKQQRVGMGGRQFTLLKFRTMAADPPSEGLKVTASSDPRITVIGARLRSSKLDELPQLVNVLRGEMSLVGPRPEVAMYVSMWPEPERELILSVRPGITDPATLRLRREEELLAEQEDPEAFYTTSLLPLKVRAYSEYARSRTTFGDLRILFSTLRQVIRE